MTAPTHECKCPEWLTVEEAAAHLRVNVNTVYAWLNAGVIRALRLPVPGAAIRIPRDRILDDAKTAFPTSGGDSLPEATVTELKQHIERSRARVR